MTRMLKCGVAIACAMLVLRTAPAYAVRVGWTTEIPQMKFANGNPNGNFADGYHVWGVLELFNASPTLADQSQFETNGPPNFQKVVPGANLATFNSTITRMRRSRGTFQPGRRQSWGVR